MIKKIFILSVVLTISPIMAKNIILIDDSKGILTQRKIKACDESIIKKQKRDIEHIKHQLSTILKKLSKMEREKYVGIKSKSKRAKKSRKSKKRRVKKDKKEGKYITVIVKRGDRLADYAKKYYGNSKLYYKIYRANRDKIGDDLNLKVGDRIIIPLDKDYKYKKSKHIKKNLKIINSPKKDIELLPKLNYSKAKKYIATPKRDIDIQMLDKPVYIESESNKIDTSDFIPLDEN